MQLQHFFLRCQDEGFCFAGFLPKTKSQILEILKKSQRSDLVFYDSPNRIINTLKILSEAYPDAKVAVGRELTKVFEEIKTGNVHDVIRYFEDNVMKGEIVAMVYRSNISRNDIDLDEKIDILKSKNFKAKEISTIISSLFNINKNEVYQRVLER